MNDNPCCEEYERAAELSRRRFMATVAAGAGLGVAATSFGGVFRQAAFGAQRDNNVVVVISLRGGIDGLSVVVPYKETNYYSSRPGIADPRGLADLQERHLRAAPGAAADARSSGTQDRFAAVQAVGLKVPDRSHFSAMEAVEDADPGSTLRRGWINRAIGLDNGAFPTEAVQFGTSIIPTALVGPCADHRHRRASPACRWPPPTRSGTAPSGGAVGVRQLEHRLEPRQRARWAGRPGRPSTRSQQMAPYARQTYTSADGRHVPERLAGR